MTRIAAVAVTVALAGCPKHLKHNAPGHIDVLASPANMESERVEKPRDPGENVVTIGYGGFAGIGGRVGDHNGLASELGVEVGVHWGSNTVSHTKGQPILPLPEVVLPKRRRGVNIGWAIGEVDPRNTDELETGPIYVEYAESKFVYGWTAGYAVDPSDASHGPHVAVNGFGYYAKAAYRTERGFEVFFGAVLKLPQSLVWSK